jgi:hypothetical protein
LAVFNLESQLLILLLLICTCTYVRAIFPTSLQRDHGEPRLTFWKLSRIGALGCTALPLTDRHARSLTHSLIHSFIHSHMRMGTGERLSLWVAGICLLWAVKVLVEA